MRRGAWRRGIALADFITGMVIFSAALSAFVTLSRSKLDTIEFTKQRSVALSAVEERLDRLRVEGLQRNASGLVDEQGFRVAEEFGAPAELPAGQGRVEVRPLRVQGGSRHGLYEVRVRVSWETHPGRPSSRTEVGLSTVTPLPEDEPTDEPGAPEDDR